jgi:hypothetical protein
LSVYADTSTEKEPEIEPEEGGGCRGGERVGVWAGGKETGGERERARARERESARARERERERERERAREMGTSIEMLWFGLRLKDKGLGFRV